MTLCSSCQKIDLHDLYSCFFGVFKKLGPLWDRNVQLRKPLVSSKSYQIHESILAAKTNRTDCELCELICQGWLQYYSRVRVDYKGPCIDELRKLGISLESPVHIYVLDGQHGKVPKPLLKITFGDAAPKWSDRTSSEGPVWFELCASNATDSVIEDVDDLLRPLVIPFKDSGSEGCLFLAKTWLETCLTTHNSCSREMENVLPTRIIDVGDNERAAILYMSHGETGSWIALSYCWGGDSDFKLTDATLQRLTQGVPLEDFPPTIRDAIKITRSLGVKYLWVDALCIFQDSKEDWEIEAPKMGSIYTNAVLTVVAASSSSVNDGIFSQRIPRPNSWEFPWSSNPNKPPCNNVADQKSVESGVVLREHFPMENLDDLPGPHNCIWASRGWTMQEDLLSWRTLTYTSSQMIWQCSTAKAWEKGQIGTQGPREIFSRFKQLPRESGTEPTSKTTPALRSRIYEDWDQAVSSYSARTLTFPSDRLPAISGIAKKIELATGDRYLAGLWEKDLLYGLLWKPSQFQRTENSQANLVAFSGYIGPSWSWVSLNTRVNIHMRIATRGTLRNSARVQEVALDYVSSNIFGAVKGGFLVLEAPCYKPSSFTEEEAETSNFQRFLARTVKADPEFQIRHKSHAGQQFAAIQILQHSENKQEGFGTVFEFLLLESVLVPDNHASQSEVDIVYHRVGQLTVRPTK